MSFPPTDFRLFCMTWNIRGRAFAPHADLLWMETAKPNISEACRFAEGVHATVPHQKLAYNLSPSFNWDAAGMSKAEMSAFNRELGRLGFVWQVRDGHTRCAGVSRGCVLLGRSVMVVGAVVMMLVVVDVVLKLNMGVRQ